MTCRAVLDIGPGTTEGAVEGNSPLDSKGFELKGTCDGCATRNSQDLDRQNKRNFQLSCNPLKKIYISTTSEHIGHTFSLTQEDSSVIA